MRVANKDAKQYIDRQEKFIGSNTFGEQADNLYVVYSYGHHFPMYIYDRQAGEWIGNKGRDSVSTTRQQSHCRPSDLASVADGGLWLDNDQMQRYVSCGSMMSYMEYNARQEVAFLTN